MTNNFGPNDFNQGGAYDERDIMDEYQPKTSIWTGIFDAIKDLFNMNT